jgi:hypothetical protein
MQCLDLRKNLNNFVSSPEVGYPDQDRHKFREGHKIVLCAMSRRSSSDPGGKFHSNLGHKSLKDLLVTLELYSSPGLLGETLNMDIHSSSRKQLSIPIESSN